MRTSPEAKVLFVVLLVAAVALLAAKPAPAPEAPAVHFLGVTVGTVESLGIGPLVTSALCDSEFPGARTCSDTEVVKSIPLVKLPTTVWVMAEGNAHNLCMAENGHSRSFSCVLHPVACCGL